MLPIQIVLIACLSSIACSLQCSFGFLSKGPLDPCVIKGCMKQTPNQLCQINGCKPGFAFYNPGYCFAQKCVDASASQCNNCVQGYQSTYGLSSNIKICKPYSCADVISNSSGCKKCSQGYSLLPNGGCYPINCKTFTQDNICTQCIEKYRVYNNKCVPDTCVSYNKIQDYCEECLKGYMLINNNRNCILQSELCTNFNQITGLCSSCIPGYKLVGLIKCIKQSPNCIQYNLQGCEVCDKEFTVKNRICILKGCKQSVPSNTSQCRRCDYGYQLNQSRKCIIGNCVSYDKQLQACFSCQDRFEYNSVLRLCVTKNCTLFDRAIPSKCVYCNPEYLLVNGQCHLLNCNTPKANECTKCNDGWLQNVNKNCLIKDCQTYTGIQCASCYPGKRLFRGQCIKDNCLLRLSNNDCLQCEKQLFVPAQTKNICVPSFCANYDPVTGECLECYPDFELDSQNYCLNKFCVKKQQKIGFVHPQCTICRSGYRPEDRYCVPERCKNYNLNTGTCNQCLRKYELKKIPGFLEQPEVCVNYNCLKFTTGQLPICQICRTGYQYDISNNECLVMNCSSYFQESQTLRKQCAVCQPSFQLFFGICSANNCQLFSNNGLCQQCFQGYSLTAKLTCQRVLCLQQNQQQCLKCQRGYYISNNGSCQPYNCLQTDKKIIKENAKIPVCKKCSPNFVLEGSFCVKTNCQNFNEQFECKTCKKGFTLQNKTCIFIRQLGICFKGQLFNSLKFICEPIKIPFCQYTDTQDAQKCIKCQDGYLLLQGSCYNITNCLILSYYTGCSKCVSGFNLTNPGICIDSIPNCREYEANQKCKSCLNGHSLISIPAQKCQKVPQSCAFLNNEGKCAACRDPTQIINNNTCIYFSQKCLSYHNVYGQCTKCQVGYYYSELTKKCRRNPQACVAVSSNDKCLSCSQLSILYSGRCYPPISHCLTRLGPSCIICQTGYYIDAGEKCALLPINCNKALQSGACTQCQPNYYLAMAGCIRKIQFCEVYDQSVRGCIKCMTGYSASDNKLFCLFGQKII